MPTYTFEHLKTGVITDFSMTMSERDEFVMKNKDYRQVFTTLNIIGGVAGLTHKPDSGFQDVVQKIAEKHPGSPLADRFRKKSIKEIRTKQVIDKHRKRKKNGR